MKLTTRYSVAVYTAQQCLLTAPSNIEQDAFTPSGNQDLVPDSNQLECIQKHAMTHESVGHQVSNIVVVVPDHWISISQHRVDHIVPTDLAPLAALSYAAETTFSMPETLMFYYQRTVLEEKQTQLTVFACSSEWAAQLCLPFQSLGASCLLMSQTQWAEALSFVRHLSWIALRKHALVLYQPDQEKRKKTKRLWILFVLLSVFIHSGAYSYFFILQQQTEAMLKGHQKTSMLKSDWELNQKTTPFIASILKLAHALPISIRLVQLEANADHALFQMTLPQHELTSLLERWRQEYVSWQFESEQVFDDPSFVLKGEEVIDVSISVFKN